MHYDNLWLKDELKKAGVKQYELARYLGFSEWQFSKLLREPVKKVSVVLKWKNIIQEIATKKRK